MAEPQLNSVSIEEFRRLQDKLDEVIRKQNQQQSPQKSTSRVVIEKDPPPEYGSGMKLTKLPTYDGNRKNYPSWRTAVLDIFRMDWNAFGYDESRAFVMIHGALKGTALEKAGPFYEAGRVNGTRKPEDFLEFLDRINLDPMRAARANNELLAMRIKDYQRWPEFYASWSNKLTEARGDFWDDTNKISMLQNSLTDNLKRTLAGNHLLPSDNFNEWVSIVNKVAQPLEMVESSSKRRRNFHPNFDYSENSCESSTDNVTHRQNGYKDYFEKGRIPMESHGKQQSHRDEVDGAGDTIMGGINAASVPVRERRRAKWKTQAQLEKLRKEGRCFRCERQGCSSRKCPLLPARNPKKNGTHVNSVILPEIDPSVYEVELERQIDSSSLNHSEN